jgi:hypothetical protein
MSQAATTIAAAALIGGLIVRILLRDYMRRNDYVRERFYDRRCCK